jgi:hypothetical protein
VPLDADPEREGRIFEGFDEAVGRQRGGDESVAEAVDALMVAGVDGETLEAQGFGEARAGPDFDVMHVGAVTRAAVGETLAGQVGQVLVEGAPALDVHGLAAHADAEGRQGAGFGEGEHGEVEVLAVPGGASGGGVRGLAEEGGVEVVAAGDEEGVERSDHVSADVGVVGERQENGHAAGLEDALGVVGGEFERLASLVGGADVHGDADAGAAGGGGSWRSHMTPGRKRLSRGHKATRAGMASIAGSTRRCVSQP